MREIGEKGKYEKEERLETFHTVTSTKSWRYSLVAFWLFLPSGSRSLEDLSMTMQFHVVLKHNRAILTSVATCVRHKVSRERGILPNQASLMRMQFSANLQTVIIQIEINDRLKHVCVPFSSFNDACKGLFNTDSTIMDYRQSVLYQSAERAQIDQRKAMTIFFNGLEPLYLEFSTAMEATLYLRALLWLKSFLSPRQSPWKRCELDDVETHYRTILPNAQILRFRHRDCESEMVSLVHNQKAGLLGIETVGVEDGSRTSLYKTTREVIPVSHIRCIDERTDCAIFGLRKWVMSVQFRASSRRPPLHLALPCPDSLQKLTLTLRSVMDNHVCHQSKKCKRQRPRPAWLSEVSEWKDWRNFQKRPKQFVYHIPSKADENMLQSEGNIGGLGDKRVHSAHSNGRTALPHLKKQPGLVRSGGSDEANANPSEGSLRKRREPERAVSLTIIHTQHQGQPPKPLNSPPPISKLDNAPTAFPALVQSDSGAHSPTTPISELDFQSR
eukprot:g82727.t1